MEPTYRGGHGDAINRVLTMQQVAAQTKQLEASARLTNATAAVEEAKIPHAANMAQASMDLLQDQVVSLGQQIEKMDIDINTARLTNEQLEKMMPLLIEAQKLANQAEQLNMSEREVAAKFFKDSGTASRWFQLLKIAASVLGNR